MSALKFEQVVVVPNRLGVVIIFLSSRRKIYSRRSERLFRFLRVLDFAVVIAVAATVVVDVVVVVVVTIFKLFYAKVHSRAMLLSRPAPRLRYCKPNTVDSCAIAPPNGFWRRRTIWRTTRAIANESHCT